MTSGKSIKQKRENQSVNFADEKVQKSIARRPLKAKKEERKKYVKTPKHTSSKMLICVLYASYVNIGVYDFKSFRHCAYTYRNNDNWETSLRNDFVKSTPNVERKTC